MRKMLLFVGLLFGGVSTFAGITVPGADGSDGVLHITSNTVIDLSLAVTDSWDADNSANAGQGVYDSEKWAIVFKYSNVTIDQNCTLTFSNHPANPPVVWLVSSNVVISGTIDISGKTGHPSSGAAYFSIPGPGGFGGGAAFAQNGNPAGFGFGAGGVKFGTRTTQTSYAEYGSETYDYLAYGNPEVIPLIGGSGGRSYSSYGGGAGGGGLLIAAQNEIIVNSSGGIWSKGGYISSDRSRNGSGGAIRLICQSFSNRGVITVKWDYRSHHPSGRIRIDANVQPVTSGTLYGKFSTSVVGSTALLWPVADAPSIAIVEVDGEPVSDDPMGNHDLSTYGRDADVQTGNTGDLEIVLEGKNITSNDVVTVIYVPTANPGAIATNAAFDGMTDSTTSLWSVNVDFSEGVSLLYPKVEK